MDPNPKSSSAGYALPVYVPQQSVRDALPSLYRSLLPDSFERSIHKEVEATCHDCAMCSRKEPKTAAYFSPDVKCCTYHPTLHNYLVGALLADTDAQWDEGRCRIRAKIRNRSGVTPHGVLPPRKHAFLYRTNVASAFGRAASFLCPYYDHGQCTVWAFRESTCSTWYCKHVRGYEGFDFWTALRNYGQYLEVILARYALHRMGWPADRILNNETSSLTPEDLDEKPPPDNDYRDLWCDWAGREEDFYRETFKIITSLTKDDVAGIVGLQSVLLEQHVEAKRQAMMVPKLPPILKRNPALVVERTSDDQFLISTAKSLQPTLIRRAVYEMLDYFDGQQTNTEVVECLRKERRVDVKTGLLLHLHQYRILISAASR